MNGIFMHQRPLTRAVVKRYKEEIHADKIRKVHTPAFAKDEYKEGADDDEPGDRAATAARHIGGSLYIQRQSRPDISVAVGKLSRRTKRWTKRNDKELHRLMAYLVDAEDYGVAYSIYVDIDEKKLNRTIHVEHYVDADHGGCPGTGRSTSGWAVFRTRSIENVKSRAKLSWCLLAWGSKLQPASSYSTAESEYVSIAVSLQRAGFPVVLMLEDIYPDRKCMLDINVDNEAAESICKSGDSTKLRYLRKHQRVSQSWVNDAIAEQDDRQVSRVDSGKDVADGFTKSLLRDRFEEFRSSLGMMSLKEFKDEYLNDKALASVASAVTTLLLQGINDDELTEFFKVFEKLNGQSPRWVSK